MIDDDCMTFCLFVVSRPACSSRLRIRLPRHELLSWGVVTPARVMYMYIYPFHCSSRRGTTNYLRAPLHCYYYLPHGADTVVPQPVPSVKWPTAGWLSVGLYSGVWAKAFFHSIPNRPFIPLTFGCPSSANLDITCLASKPTTSL
jgi:hypothetical protein